MTVEFLAGAGWEPFKHWPIWRFLLYGLWLAIKIAGASIAISLAIGIVMAVGRLAPVRLVRWLASTYVEVFRATPLLLLLFFVFFGVGAGRTGEGVDAGHLERIPAVAALSLYNSAVVAEIMRAGIDSISHGIIEAARALGLTYLQSDALRRGSRWPCGGWPRASSASSSRCLRTRRSSASSAVVELLRRGRLIYD